MREILLCKYGEIVLKGANRRYFEETLCKTLRFRAKHYGNFNITRSQSTLTIEPLDDMADVDGMFESASKCLVLSASAVVPYAKRIWRALRKRCVIIFRNF